MPPDNQLNVVLCWHMHQPEYRDSDSGNISQPWAYLRAIKDYADMAAHLEQVPDSRAVINFSPLLLAQIDDYNRQFNAYFVDNQPPREPILAALVEPAINVDPQHRYQLVKACLSHHNFNSGQHFEQYVALTNIGRHILDNPGHLDYVSDEFFTDLLVWFHLTWLGETVRRDDPRAQTLIKKARRYTMFERIQLVRIISEQISQIIPRYRALASANTIELSMTAYGHPIAPLLLDLQSATEATPQLAMPEVRQYPGGAQRLQWHIDRGREVFIEHFGEPPRGCWPAEGAISYETLAMLNNSGFSWTASGAAVLQNSLSHDQHRQQPQAHSDRYCAYHLPDQAIRCFFRDDQLSDLIGFTYASWHADDAVANFIQRLEEIAAHCAEQQHSVVAIIMDGENAWEHYHHNGYFFLRELYRRLASHPDLNLTTFSDCLATQHRELNYLRSGSWVQGNLATWVGNADKNRAWEILIEAKQCFDRVIQSGRLSPEEQSRAEQQLAVCEGSDWFWWPGGDNPPETIAAFDRLYRMHLRALYQLLKAPCPDYLQWPFTHTASTEHFDSPALGGVMRKAQ
jgi:alpha-amylase/alpha-mannosidase (GH57 family)